MFGLKIDFLIEIKILQVKFFQLSGDILTVIKEFKLVVFLYTYQGYLR